MIPDNEFSSSAMFILLLLHMVLSALKLLLKRIIHHLVLLEPGDQIRNCGVFQLNDAKISRLADLEDFERSHLQGGLIGRVVPILNLS